MGNKIYGIRIFQPHPISVIFTLAEGRHIVMVVILIVIVISILKDGGIECVLYCFCLKPYIPKEHCSRLVSVVYGVVLSLSHKNICCYLFLPICLKRQEYAQ